MFNLPISEVVSFFKASKLINSLELMNRITYYLLDQGGCDMFIAVKAEEEADTPFQEVLASAGELSFCNYHYHALVGVVVDGKRLVIPAPKLGWNDILQFILKSNSFEYITREEMYEKTEGVGGYDSIRDPECKIWDSQRERFSYEHIDLDFYNYLITMEAFPPLQKIDWLQPINENPRLKTLARLEPTGKENRYRMFDAEDNPMGWVNTKPMSGFKSLELQSIYNEVDSVEWTCYSPAQLLNLEPHNQWGNETKLKELVNPNGVSRLTLTKIGFLESFQELLNPMNGLMGIAYTSPQHVKDARVAIDIMAGRELKLKKIKLTFPERFYPRNASQVFWDKVSALMEQGYTFEVRTSDAIAGNFTKHFFSTTILRYEEDGSGEIENVAYGNKNGIGYFYGHPTEDMLYNIHF